MFKKILAHLILKKTNLIVVGAYRKSNQGLKMYSMQIVKQAILISTLFFSLLATAQESKGLDDLTSVKAKCDLIVEHFKDEKMGKAFDEVRTIWVLPKNEIDFLEQKTIEQLNTVSGRFGKVIGSKFIKEQHVEGVLHHLIYVRKHEKHAIRFVFSFYQGKGDKWYLNNFKWDDKLSLLLED